MASDCCVAWQSEYAEAVVGMYRVLLSDRNICKVKGT